MSASLSSHPNPGIGVFSLKFYSYKLLNTAVPARYSYKAKTPFSFQVNAGAGGMLCCNTQKLLYPQVGTA